jgi:hypothetical protein
MVHFEMLADRGILLVTPDGPLEKADFERLAAAIDPCLATRGELAGIMINAERFPGWDSLDSLIAHFNFVASHHRKIKRIAVVTNGAFLRMMPRIAGVFVRPEIRSFDLHEKEKALAWLETDQRTA